MRTPIEQVEAVVEATEARYRTLFDYVPDGILIADANSYYLDANTSICRMLGYSREELIGLHASDIVAPAEVEHIAPALDAITNTTDYNRKWIFRRKAGTTFPAEVNATMMPDGTLLALVRDVTEREEAQRRLKKLEDQIRHGQKLEAIGQLAGGVAHDFNNLLSVILSYAELVKVQLPSDSPMRLDMSEILLAAARATDLTKQLLAFGRKQVLQPRALDVGAAVTSMQPMLRPLLGDQIELSVRVSPGLDQVFADPTQITQIVMNLAVNARDAMPDGGRMRVETSNAELDAAYCAEHHDVAPGYYVMLGITDTGTGMRDDVRDRIFEPFFTTKEQGKGTGLGLATVFGIVKQSHGHIAIDSELGRGTTFRVYLPRATHTPTQSTQP